MLINYYRDHGYAMGHRVHYSGTSAENRGAAWPHVHRYRTERQHVATLHASARRSMVRFFTGAMIGMFIPACWWSRSPSPRRRTFGREYAGYAAVERAHAARLFRSSCSSARWCVQDADHNPGNADP
jgi:hypothetical protein